MPAFEYPAIDMKDNLLMTKEKGVVAYYKVPSISVTVTDVEKKTKVKQDVGRVLRKLLPQHWFEISLIPKDFRLVEKMEDTAEVLAKDAKKIGIEVLNKTMYSLTKEMEIPYQYEWIIGIPLNKTEITMDIKQLVKDKLEEVTEKVMKGLGYEVEMQEDWHEDWRNEESEVYQTLSALRANRLSDEELFYYQRYQFLRYIPHKQEDVCVNRDIRNVTDTRILVKRPGELRLYSEYGKSFVSVLPVGKIPTLLNYQHLGETLQQFNFPVELKIKAGFTKINGETGIKGKMGRSRKRTKNIIQEAHNAGSVQQDRIIEGKISLDDLEKKVGNKEPILDFGMYIVVSASSKEQLKIRKKAVMSALQNMKVKVSAATFDQPYLFQSILMGKKLEKTSRKWLHTATSNGMAEQMLFTTTFSGTNSGFYLGRVDNNFGKWDSLEEAIYASRNIVLFNHTIANKEGIAGKVTKNPHIFISGETGSGKSVLAQNIFLHHSKLNVKLLYVDPKKELREHYTNLCKNEEFRKKNPELVAYIESFNFVTLDAKNESNHGVLDPIVILDKTDAIETAKSMIDYLGNDTWQKDEKTAISKAIKKVVNLRAQGKQVGFKHVIEELRNHSEEKIKQTGEYLFEMIDGTILDLAFSDGKTKGLNYDARVTILEIANLSLPKEKTEKVSGHERDSVVLMFALGNFCKRFGEMNRHEETMEFFDEAWVLTASAEGQKVIKNMRRVGRSQNNTLVLITQSVNDGKSEEDTTGFGTVFAFYERNERAEILKHVGLEVNETNLEWLDNMSSGQCLFRDVFGNLNRISIHVHLPEWLELFSPMKSTASSDIENKYARAG